MNKTIISLSIIGIAIGLTGCATKGIECVSPDNEKIKVEAFGTGYGKKPAPAIAKDRFNLGGEAIYDNDFHIKDKKASASISKMSQVFTWSGLVADNQILVDANNNTVQVGKDTYVCKEDLNGIIKQLEITQDEYIKSK